MGRGKHQASLELVAASYEILEEIQPATVRAVCYRLFVGGLIPDMRKNSTRRVSTQLTWAREHDHVPWKWIVDETREAERATSWGAGRGGSRGAFGARIWLVYSRRRTSSSQPWLPALISSLTADGGLASSPGADHVYADAQARLNQSGSYGQRGDRAKRDIAEGAEIVVVPELQS